MSLIMVIAGSNWQIPIVKKIKQMGYKSFVVNLHENSPAFKYADYYEVVDILDKDKCLNIAIKYKIDAVVSEQADIAMPTVAYIAEKLNLHSLGSKSAALYTNKALMREFSLAHNLPCPDFLKCFSKNEAENFLDKLNQPIIIKPLDSNSSRGVFRIDNKKQLDEKFEEAISFSKTEKAVLAERYIEGKEFTVDGIKSGNKHFTLAISEKKHYEHNTNIAYELFFSNYNQSYDYSILKNENDRFVELSELPDGTLTHAEYKYENGIFYLIEIGARGGGQLVSSHIVPLMSGVDNYKYLINASLGISNSNIVIDENLKNRCAVLFFFNTPNDGGIVKDIFGLEFLEQSKNIIKYKLNFGIGDRIENAKNDATRIGYYIAFAESKEELLNIQGQIDSKFKIIYKKIK